MGLAATGSQTMAIDGELFVPDERFSTPGLLASRIGELTAQGRGPRRGGLARSLVTGTGTVLGMADHAMEVFFGGLGERTIAYSPYANQAVAPITHLTVGRAHSQISAAGLVADAAVAALDACDRRGEDPTDREILQFHTDVAYVWDACSSAVETLLRASGASAITKRQPLQLIARNCRAGSLHAAHTIDTWTENIGRALCGVEVAPTFARVLERHSWAIGYQDRASSGEDLIDPRHRTAPFYVQQVRLAHPDELDVVSRSWRSSGCSDRAAGRVHWAVRCVSSPVPRPIPERHGRCAGASRESSRMTLTG